MKNRDRSNPLSVLSVLVLWVALFAVYQEVGTHAPIPFDDALYVTSNAVVKGGLSGFSVGWAFTNVEVANWHPVTWLSHLLDQTVMPGAYGLQILEGVVWHGINASLLYFLLIRLGVGCAMAWALALVFVCHPLNVESVAWLSQRKNQLGLCFMLLAVRGYLQEREAPTRWGPWCVVFWFALSLMSKAMAIPLPVLLWAYEVGRDWARSGMRDWRRQPWLKWGLAGLRRVAPLLMIAVVFSGVAFWAQQKMGAVAAIDALSVKARVFNALAGFGTYVQAFFVPGELTLFYPLSSVPNDYGAVVGVLTVAVVSVWVVGIGRLHLLAVWGWGWFLLMLFPVIGLIQVGSQSHADRYMYLPMIGLLLVVGAGLPNLMGALGVRKAERWAVALVLAFAVGLGWQARAYLIHWENAEAAYSRSLDIGGKSHTMMVNLTLAYLAERKLHAAERSMVELRRAYPRDIKVLLICSAVYVAQSRSQQALEVAELMTKVDPQSPYGWLGLAVVNKQMGRTEGLQQAITHLEGLMKMLDSNGLSPAERMSLTNTLVLMETMVGAPAVPE